MNRIRILTCAALAALLSGCFTLTETDYPQTVVNAAPAGLDIGVQLAGFEASVTSYTPVYGYSTVIGGGYGGRHRYVPYTSTVMTQTYVPQTSLTTAFLDRATELMEKGGYLLKTASPTFRVEVKFDGPFVTDGEYWATFAWNILSLLTADQGHQTWTAKLKVYEIATGRLMFYKDYSQPYSVTVWGPIPIFSPFASDKTNYSAMQSWCLTALTDQAVADATQFLSTLPGTR